MKQLMILFSVFALSFSIYGNEIDIEDEFTDTSEFIEENPFEHIIVQVTKKNFKKFLRSDRPLIIDFYTDWCGPCKHMHKVIEELNQGYGHLYQFGKINAEKEKYLSTLFGVSSFPTVIFIKEGKVVGRQKGFIDKEIFLHKMEKFFQEIPPL